MDPLRAVYSMSSVVRLASVKSEAGRSPAAGQRKPLKTVSGVRGTVLLPMRRSVCKPTKLDKDGDNVEGMSGYFNSLPVNSHDVLGSGRLTAE